MNYKLVKRTLLTLFGLMVLTVVHSTVLADALPEPTGQVLLTITGDIERKNSEIGAQFDYDMLERLEFVEKNVITPWTEPESIFSGVLLRSLMEQVGASGNWVRAIAANDYSANIPLSDLTQFDTLLALSHNGKRMRLRDKGPLWLIYPNDSRPDKPESEINTRMVWQLVSLRVYR
jgi:hypothetical protein